jgi:hypothetical protein
MATPLLYDEISVGDEIYGPLGVMVKIANKHHCNDEKRVIYVLLSSMEGTRYSVPYGRIGNNFYATQPSNLQVFDNQEEMNRDDEGAVPDFNDPSTEEDNQN